MPGLARNTDPQSSHDAAANAPTLALAARYMAALYKLGPMSTTEIARYWDMPRDSFSPRTRRLLDQGLIICLGRRPTPNPSGRVVSMNVYDLTTKGRAVVARVQAKHKHDD